MRQGYRHARSPGFLSKLDITATKITFCASLTSPCMITRAEALALTLTDWEFKRVVMATLQQHIRECLGRETTSVGQNARARGVGAGDDLDFLPPLKRWLSFSHTDEFCLLSSSKHHV